MRDLNFFTSVRAQSESMPLPSVVFPSLKQQSLPILLALATSLTQEYTYEAQVEGRIPEQLHAFALRVRIS